MLENYPKPLTYVYFFFDRHEISCFPKSEWGCNMSRRNDRKYHEARAKDELRRAEEASDPAVANVHRELAALHRRQMMEIVERPVVEPPIPAPPAEPKQAS